MFTETQYRASPTGANLAWHHQPAQRDARGVVLIAHGMSEHSKRYAEFAYFLGTQGYHVYGFDHRGHGETSAPDAVQGQFARKDGVEKVIADTIAMRDLAAQMHPSLPIILFGHSMGALIAFNVARSHSEKFAAFAVWNTDFSAYRSAPLMKAVLRLEAMFKGSDTPSAMLPRLTFDAWGRKVPDHKTLFDWLSTDRNEVSKYIADPLCGFPCTVSLWRDVAELILQGADTRSWAAIPKTKPFHLVGGDGDPSTNNGKAITWLADRLAAAGFSNVTRVIYSNTRHETLLDDIRGRAMQDFADWAARIG